MFLMFLTWQHISKSHRTTTKLVAANTCLLVDVEAILIFIPIIVMLIVPSLNIISVVGVAADAVVAALRCRCDGVNVGVFEMM